jgi:threonylcarbamoyladenosine tRNA methylthiotransferase MtaB
MPSRPRVRLQSLGCRLNEAELEAWADTLRARGFALAGDDEPADLIIINTCAVTQEATRKSRQLVRRAHRDNPTARLVVSGCLASLDAQTLAGEAGVDLLVDNQSKDRLVEIAAAALSLPVISHAKGQGDSAAVNPWFDRGRQRAFIKVQDGCRYACTFCVTTQARGEERSRPMPEIIAAVRRAAASGVREVLLTGVHLGGYGGEIGSNLSDLLRAVLDQTGIPRIRLGSLEPWDLPDDFWDLFANPRLLPHLHLPMQSGADSVLRRMARRCKTGEFDRLAARGRAAVPGLNLTTDIIAGFPGETETEWQETLAFVAAMAFGQVHGFAYSPRAGTRAATLPDQVDTDTKRRRCRELKDLADGLRHRLLLSQVGLTSQVLREGPSRLGHPGDLFGYTPNYLPILVDPGPDAAAIGEVMQILIRGVTADGAALRGCLANCATVPNGAVSCIDNASEIG